MSEREEELEGLLRDAAKEIFKYRRENDELKSLHESFVQAQAHQEMEIMKLLDSNMELETLLKRSDEKMLEAITIVKEMNGSMSDMREKLQQSLILINKNTSEPTIINEITAITKIADAANIDDIIDEYEHHTLQQHKETSKDSMNNSQ